MSGIVDYTTAKSGLLYYCQRSLAGYLLQLGRSGTSQHRWARSRL